MKLKQKSYTRKKAIAVSQIISLVLEIFAFSFILGGMAVFTSPSVSADLIPTGCCTEGVDGSVCLEMNLGDTSLCKSAILPTKCNQVDNCQLGCCYGREEGICAFNSPKEKCQDDGGNWSASALCQIQECSLGCCVLGDQASITTSRECTLKSRDLGLARAFQPLDADGTCNSKTSLQKMGACTLPAADFSGENECRFVSKSQCQTFGGNFYQDYLCTAESLNSTCFPAKNTTCIQGDDKIYYLDTCGNKANIYDSNRFSDQEYWEKIILPEDSCTGARGSTNCGNCNYMSGSMCFQYREDKDPKPTYGQNICRNLNCANGRKHGESWCITEYDTSLPAISPIGSRFFRGVCLYGEIKVEPCADFNQEICQEGQSGSITEAKCTTNQWRSCIAANDYDTYEDVKTACEGFSDQCVMFSDLESGGSGECQQDSTGKYACSLRCPEKGGYNSIDECNDKCKGAQEVGCSGAGGNPSGNSGGNSNGSGYSKFPGFFSEPKTIVDPLNGENTITWNGAVGDIGKDMNGRIPYCVPKYTPGMVFWTTDDSNSTNTGLSYGGSYIETKALCSMGNFNCVTELKKEGTGNFAKYSKVNYVCYGDKNTPTFVEALNERCRTLGPCGLYVNIAGEPGKVDKTNSSFSQLYINENGDVGEWKTPTGFDASENYIAGLGEKAAITQAPGTLASLTQAVVLAIITGRAADYSGASKTQAETAADEAAAKAPADPMGWYAGLLGLLGVGGSMALAKEWGMLSPGAVEGTKVTATAGSNWGAVGGTLAWAIIAAAAGYVVGQMTAKWFGFSSNAQAQAYSESLALGGATWVVTYSIASNLGPNALGTGFMSYSNLIGFVIAALVAWYYYTTTVEKTEYYVTHYECKPWQPPLTGDCAVCNNDIRPCSEYRCRALGQNCHYFTGNGEPGWCAQNDEIWSATISPWKEALSDGYKYNGVAETHFEITSASGGLVPAGTGIQFGVKTSKQATCKVDTAHTQSFDEMRYDMIIDDTVGCEAGQCVNQGIYHKIALSPHVTSDDSLTESASTLKLMQGDNEYYIRCRNFAGQYNRAEFVVKVMADDGPDLTPPIITSFRPTSGSYVKLGENSSSIMLWVNEPAECRYSQEYNSRFEQMNKTLACVTGGNSAVLGNWPCYGTLSNLIPGENKVYFQCRDQPELLEEQSSSRNINRNSKEYSLNVCSMGLNITSIAPANSIISGRSPISVQLEANTVGCVAGGKATCYYKFNNGFDIPFVNTGGKYHTQNFTSIINGTHNILVSCEDDAGNKDNRSTNITVFLDDTAPSVIKSYTLGKALIVQTDEDSTCRFITNSSVGCGFNFDSDNSTSMTGTGKYHSANFQHNTEYFVKCGDIYGNNNFDCGIVVKTYDFNQQE
jgi:hypothetical protein